MSHALDKERSSAALLIFLVVETAFLHANRADFREGRVGTRHRNGATVIGTVHRQVTRPSFCTTGSERVYITARGCETELVATRGL